MTDEKFYEDLREKINLLEKEKDKIKMEELIIDIMVNLEKFCHEDDIQIHGVLAKTRERCKKEIKK